MRILVVSDLYPPVSYGGYEMECATVVEHLRERHDVTVLTSDRDRDDAPPAAGVRRELPFSGASRSTAVAAPLHALRAARVARAALASAQPELVFTWNGTAIPTAALRVAVDHGVPVVHRLCERWFAQHVLLGDHFLRHLAGARRGPRARLMRLANRHPELRLDAVAPYRAAISWNSEALRRAVRLPAMIEPVLERTIHPATRTAERLAGLERRPSPRPSLLFVGRLGWQKGADVAVRALGALRERHGIEAELVIAGPFDAAGAREVEALAATAGVAGRVQLRGRLGAEALGAALQQAHVLVAPSRQEAFGLACVEAAAARVPVVASRADGIPEALRDAEHALLFAVDDVTACADAVARTLQRPEETAARVARAAERARELSVKRYLAATDAFLDDAVGRWEARAA